MTAALSPGDFLVGCALLALTVGACVVAARAIERHALSDLDGVVRFLALAILTIVGLLTVHLLPLALGVLGRGSAAITSLVLALLTVAASRRLARARGISPSARVSTPAGSGGLVSLALAVTGTLLLAGWTVAYLQSHVEVPVTSADMLGFHLPGVIGYLQSGSLWHVSQFIPGQAQAFYPQDGDTLLLLVVLPWHSLAFIRYVDPVLLGVTGVALYALARELGAPAASAALGSCALLTIRPVLGTGLVDVLVDPAFLAGFGTGLLFLLRHWRTGRQSELVLAGLGFGIALGTKWYGLTDVPFVILIWGACALREGRRLRRVLVDAGILAGVVAAAGGIWMLRNLILTGNPVFDLRVTVLGTTIFPAPASRVRAQVGFSIARYFGDPTVLRQYVWPVIRSHFGLIGALAAAAVPIAPLVSWLQARRAAGRQLDLRIVLLALCSVALALAYTITPYSALGLKGRPVLVAANTRYAVPALMTAMPLLAWLVGRLGRWAVVLNAVLLAALAVNLHRYVPAAAAKIAAAALLVACLSMAWRLVPRERVGVPGRVLLLAGAGCVAMALAYHWQRLLSKAPYTPSDPTIAYLASRPSGHARIGITGSWTVQGLVPVAPLFGRRLDNDVQYVGAVVEHRTEQPTSAAAFQSALRRGRLTWLEVGTGFPPTPDPIQQRWAEQVGYVPVAVSPRLVLLRAR